MRVPIAARGDGHQAIRTPPEGQDTRDAIPTPQIAPYCPSCGHDTSTHRGGRCWVDALGNPIYRTRSLIDCTCTDERTTT
jgi:hypothetical protein